MNTLRDRALRPAFATLLGISLLGCAPSSLSDDPLPSGQLEKITFQAAFLAQGNISFTAAYVARDKGFFADEGLDVEIQHSSPGGGEQMQLLAARQIEFTTQTGPNFVKMMSTPSAPPFMAVALFGHESDHALMVLEEGPIRTIQDLRGKRIAFKTGESVEPPWMLAMLSQANLSLQDVDLIPVGFDPRVILPDYGRGKVDAVQVFKSNEPNILRRAGFKVRLFAPEDFGIHFLGQIYLTHRDLLRERPDVVVKFLRATFRAVAYILQAEPPEITDIVLNYAGSDADRAHNEFMWQTEVKSLLSDCTREVGLGYACPEEWNRMIDLMVEFGSLSERVPLEKFWDSGPIESIYDEEGDLIGS